MVDAHRIVFVKTIRDRLDKVLILMPLPRINPNVLSGLSVLMSVFFLLTFRNSVVMGFCFIFLSLIFDLLDGMVAKKYGLSSDEGYIIDIYADRLSEGLLFIAFMNPWFYLFALNNLLAWISYIKKSHFILPARHIFLVYYLFEVVMV